MSVPTNPYAYQPMPQAPVKKHRRWPWILGMVGTFILGLIIGGAGSSDTTPAATSTPLAATTTHLAAASAPPALATMAPPAPSPAAPAPSPTPAGPATTFGDGTWTVGDDIQPGRYRTSGPTGGYPMCYWERDKDTNGDMNSILANDNTQGPTTVTIKSTDKAFKTTGCATWTKVG